MKYKPGDIAPVGTLERAAWTLVQNSAGLRQTACPICGLMKFPQELTKQVVVTYSKSPRGREDSHFAKICTDCALPPDLRLRIVRQFSKCTEY